MQNSFLVISNLRSILGALVIEVTVMNSVKTVASCFLVRG